MHLCMDCQDWMSCEFLKNSHDFVCLDLKHSWQDRMANINVSARGSSGVSDVVGGTVGVWGKMIEMKNDGVDIGDDLIRELINTLTIFIFFKCFYFKNLCFLLYEFMFD